MSDHPEKSELTGGEAVSVLNPHGCTRRAVIKGAMGLGALAALGPIASACGSSSSGSASASPSASTASGPTKGGHIRSAIGGGTAKDTLDAHLSTNETQIDMQWQIYDALMGWDPEHKLVMKLAETYEANADGTEHTVKLKSGLTFHDGKSVTADDVVYSFQRMLDPKTVAVGSSSLAGLTKDNIKKVDDLTVTFVLEKANVIFFESLASFLNAIVPVGYQSPKGVDGAIGTGPWKPISYSPGQQIEFTANPDYWGEGPYADKLTMIEFADPTAKLNALLGGTVDHVTLLEASQASIVEGTSGMQVVRAKSGSWDPLVMRTDVKPFTDVRVRQAFRLIADRQQLIDQGYGGNGWLGNDMYGPFDPGYPKALPQREQDLEQARSLLKQAGYDGDLTVELTTSTGVSAADVLAAQVFAQQAKAAGVNVKVNKVDPSVFWGDQFLSWTFTQDFWATRNYLENVQLATYPGAPWNETHWTHDEWKKIVDEALATVDTDKRNELVSQAETIEYDEGGYILWSFKISSDGHTDKLQGLVEDNWGASSACKCRYNLMYFA